MTLRWWYITLKVVSLMTSIIARPRAAGRIMQPLSTGTGWRMTSIHVVCTMRHNCNVEGNIVDKFRTIAQVKKLEPSATRVRTSNQQWGWLT